MSVSKKLVFAAVAASALALSTMSSVAGATNDVLDGPAGSQLEFAEQEAVRTGRTTADVMRDLYAQDAFGGKADRVQNELPQFFVEAEWDGSTGRIMVRPEGMEAAKQLVGEDWLVSTDAPTRNERDALNRDITAAILQKKPGESFTLGIDPATLQVEVTLHAPKSASAFQELAEDAVAEVKSGRSVGPMRFDSSGLSRAQVRGSVDVTVDEEPIEITSDQASEGQNIQLSTSWQTSAAKSVHERAHAGGWDFENCTGAFSIRKGDRYGISYAHHCAIGDWNQAYNPRGEAFPTTFQSDVRTYEDGRGDTAAMWLHPGAGVPRKEVQVKYGDHRTVVDSRWTREGFSVVRYGKITNQTSYVVKEVNQTVHYNRINRTYRGMNVAVKSRGKRSIEGDSGGPWFQWRGGDVCALGIQSGYRGSRRDIYSDVNQLNFYGWYVNKR